MFCQRDVTRDWLLEEPGSGRVESRGGGQPPSQSMDLAVVRPVLEDLSMELPILRSREEMVPPPNQLAIRLPLP